MIPYSRPKLSDLYTLSQSKLLENHSLHSGTYLYSPNKKHVCMYGSTPPPAVFAQHAKIIIPKTSGNFSIREGTATGLSCSVSTCTHFSFPSCHLSPSWHWRDVPTKTDDVMWCNVMWWEVWRGEGRLLLHLQISKKTLAGQREKLYWQTCDPLSSSYQGC